MSTGEQGRGGEQDGAGLLLTHRDIRELAEAALLAQLHNHIAEFFIRFLIMNVMAFQLFQLFGDHILFRPAGGRGNVIA